MRILLTGHKGFIGSNLMKELEREGHIVIPAKVDVKDTKPIRDCVVACDAILHVGAITDTMLQDYNTMLKHNYEVTKVLVDLAKEYGRAMVYSSSASIYGESNMTTLPTNIYAWSKKLAEDYGRAVYPSGFTALRYFNVYGPGECKKGKMASVANQAYKKGSFKLFPHNPKRDFVYVDDVVSANIAAINLPAGVYDVGSGEARPFEDVLKLMDISYSITSEDMIPGSYQFYTQSDKSKWLPNWEPKYNLEKGVKKYKEYLDGK